MLLEVKRAATIIPTAAIQRGTQGTFVYVVQADNTVTMRPIKLGPTEGESAAVDSGVAAGEQVVVDGSDKLREGAKVELAGERRSRAPAEGLAPKHGGGRRRRDGDATARRDNQLRTACHEPFAPLHPAAGGDLAADGRDPAVGHRRLPAAAAVRVAGGRLPDHPGGDALPGRESRR